MISEISANFRYWQGIWTPKRDTNLTLGLIKGEKDNADASLVDSFAYRSRYHVVPCR